MDIGKHDAKFGSPVLLTLVLLIIIPSSTSYIDCRISCRRCHENTEHPAVLEVYCAMCEECKQRRRERMLGRTTKVIGKVKPTLKSLVRMRDGVEASTDSEALIIRPQESLQQAEQDSQQQYQGRPQQQLEPQQPLELQPPLEPQQLLQPQQPQQPPQEPQEPQQPQLTYVSQKALRGMAYSAGCPTPPICSDSEDEPEQLLMETRVFTFHTTSTTTTTTTTQAPPCPPVQTCRKKKKNIQHPCMNPCMVPPAMCPCPIYPPPPPPGPGYLHPPPPVPSMYVPTVWPPNAFPPTSPQWSVMQPQTNPWSVMQPQTNPQWSVMQPQTNPQWSVIQPQTNQQTQQPEIVVFQKQPNSPMQLQGPVVFPQTNQPSTMNEDFHYVFIGLPKNTI